MAGRLERGEVRLYPFEPPDKQRPVLVLTRGSSIHYLSRVTVAPITTSIRGVPSEVVLGTEDGMREPCAVNLHNLVTVAQRSLGRRLAHLGEDRMREVCGAIGFALGCGGWTCPAFVDTLLSPRMGGKGVDDGGEAEAF